MAVHSSCAPGFGRRTGAACPHELQPPSGPLDAFFTPVRRRHPDVDIVVLPLRRRRRRGTLDEAQVDETLERVARTAGRLGEAAPRLDGCARGRVGLRAGRGHRRRVGSRQRHAAEGLGAVVGLRGALEREGWRVRRLAGGRAAGRQRGDVRVRASYAEASGGVLVDLSVRADARRPDTGPRAGEA